MTDEILILMSNDILAEVANRIELPINWLRDDCKLHQLVREEDLVDAAPLINCCNLARVDPERQESLFDAALTMQPRQFENFIKVNT